MSSNLAKSWASLVSGDKEQMQNAKPEPVKVLKRAPSKSIANDTNEKKAKDESSAEVPLSAEELEHRHKQRYKQIEIGKQTIGYQNYIAQVPLSSRKFRDESHPTTPDHKQNCSKRSWDGQIKVWRRKIHFWTPKTENEEQQHLLTSSGFYEAEDKEPAFSSFSSRPLPPVVSVTMEPMQLGGSENSLLGQWAANSNSAAPMELQGESCLPSAVADGNNKDDEVYFIPFQFE